VPPQAQAVLADFDRRSVHYEALDLRAHRCKSSAAQNNLFGAALTALRRAKAAEQNGGYLRDGANQR
jgi:DNA primase large subunit